MFCRHALRHSRAMVALFVLALGALIPFAARADGPCGPPKLELRVGQTKPWQITGPPGTNTFGPMSNTLPIAQVTPAGSFQAEHGVFHIMGVERGRAFGIASYVFPGTNESGTCGVDIRVGSAKKALAAVSKPQRANPQTAVGMRTQIAHRTPGGHRTVAVANDYAGRLVVYCTPSGQHEANAAAVDSLSGLKHLAFVGGHDGHPTGVIVANNGAIGHHPLDEMGVPGPLEVLTIFPNDVTIERLIKTGSAYTDSPGSDIMVVTLDFNAMNPLSSTNSIRVVRQTGANPNTWSGAAPEITPIPVHVSGFPPRIHASLRPQGDTGGEALAEIALARGNSRFGASVNSAITMKAVGDGTFTPHATVPAPSSSAAIGWGDFNGDGILDLVVAGNTSGSPRLSVAPGTGNVPPAPLYGTSVAVGLGATGFTPNGAAMHVENLDGVHFDDIVVTRDTQLQVVTSAAPIPGIGGAPSFNAPFLINGGTWFTSVSALDLDAEGGAKTIIASDFYEDQLVYFEPVNQPGEPGRYVGEVRSNAPGDIGEIFGVYLADLNANGKKDLLLAGSGGLLPLFNTSTGETGTYSFAAGAPVDDFKYNPFRVAVTDREPDGNAGPFDHIAVAVTTNFVTVHVAFAHGQPFVELPDVFGGANFAIADLNGNGRDDLVMLNSPLRGGINNGDGTFTPFTVPGMPPFADPYAFAVGDFNGDGFPDLAYGQQRMTHILLNDGTGTGFAHAETLTAPSGHTVRAVVAADFNGNGRADLATANLLPGFPPESNVRVYLAVPGEGGGAGGSLFEAPDVFDVGPRVDHLAVADVDGDGNLDLIATIASEHSGVTNGAVIFENAGEGAFVHPTYIARTEGRPHALAIGQLDGANGPEIAVFCAPHFSGAFTGLSLHTNIVSTEPPPPPCAIADLDCNGSVGVPDLLILLANWGPCANCAHATCPADLTGNCAVGVADLLILLANWG